MSTIQLMMKRQDFVPLRLSKMVPGGGLQQSTLIAWARDSYNVQRTLQVSCRKRADELQRLDLSAAARAQDIAALRRTPLCERGCSGLSGLTDVVSLKAANV